MLFNCCAKDMAMMSLAMALFVLCTVSTNFSICITVHCVFVINGHSMAVNVQMCD